MIKLFGPGEVSKDSVQQSFWVAALAGLMTCVAVKGGVPVTRNASATE